MSKNKGSELLQIVINESGALKFETSYLRNILNISSGMDLNEFLHLLVRRVEALLINDYSRLLGILYKLDVDESLFIDCLTGRNPSILISRLIIERELKRQFFRNSYKN